MIKVCGFRVSNYHNKVLIALLEKGVPYEEDCTVTPAQTDDYLARSPMGKVPYAEVDGARLCESEVILEYLEDAYPDKALLPRNPLARAKARGAVSAQVTTALPLTAAQSKGLAAALRQSLGKDPEIETRVDPAILGGIKVQVGSRLFDASLKSKLDSLKFALKRA